MKLLSEWYSTVSEGKFNVEWVVQDKWVTLPGLSTDYIIPTSVNLNNAANGPKLFKEAMDAADKVFDFTNVQTVNFILPTGQTFMGEGSQGFPWDQAVKEYVSNEGPIASFSIPGQFFDLPGKAYWSYWAHEFGHAIGLPHIGVSRGEAPLFNPLDLMGGQDGPSRELSGWLRFYARWLPDEKVYCKEAKDLKSVELTLAPLSGQTPGLKFAIIPVSSTKAVMIESRRVTKFSCTTKTVRDGVLVYVYDAKLGHGENFLEPVFLPDRALEPDSCGSLNFRSVGPTRDMLLHEGEKISVEGISIEVLAHGVYDSIRIEKIG
jgi:M6 family metalloprotease-like protein